LPSTRDVGFVTAVGLVVADARLVGLRLAELRLVMPPDVVGLLVAAGLELTMVALRRGVESSSRIVPRPLASVICAPTAFDRITPIVSSFSFVVSPTIWTVMVLVVSPGANVSVPDAAVKSFGATAVPPAVAQLTVTVLVAAGDSVTVNGIGVKPLLPSSTLE